MRHTLVLIALLTAASAAAQPGAAPPAPTNDDCLTCHGDSELRRGDGSPLAVDPSRYGSSVHGQVGLACVDCHADLATAELPHAEKLARAQCATCHEEAVTAYGRSVHATAQPSGGLRPATCASCHTAHAIVGAKDPESPTYHLNLAATCGQCHGAQMPGAMPGGNILAQFQDSIHGRALDRAGLLVAPSCATCHGAHAILPRRSAESRVSRANVPATCGSCHEGVERVFAESVHGQAVAAGSAQAPVCIDCHTAHRIDSAREAAFRLQVVDTACGSCHKESLATYRDTFHGQATELGFAQVATCADCHTAHAQFAVSDARSSVTGDHRVQTCQKCHEGANANFAKYDPHADAHDDERGPLLYYSARFMELLLGGVFAFFGLHTVLWFTREYREVRARRGASRGDANA
jgi:hypothetical protein